MTDITGTIIPVPYIWINHSNWTLLDSIFQIISRPLITWEGITRITIAAMAVGVMARTMHVKKSLLHCSCEIFSTHGKYFFLSLKFIYIYRWQCAMLRVLMNFCVCPVSINKSIFRCMDFNYQDLSLAIYHVVNRMLGTWHIRTETDQRMIHIIWIYFIIFLQHKLYRHQWNEARVLFFRREKLEF